MRRCMHTVLDMVANRPKKHSIRDRTYSGVFRRRRFRALIVSGLAVFVGCCVVLSFGVDGFKTTSELTFQTRDDGDLTSDLRKIVRENLDDSSIKSGLAVVANQSLPNPGVLSLLDPRAIRLGITFNVQKHVTDPIYRVSLSLTGDGSMEESLLLDNLISNISDQLLQGPAAADRICEIEKHASLLARSFDVQNSYYDREWLSMEASLGQLDQELSTLYRQLKSRRPSVAGNSAVLVKTDVVAELQSLLDQIKDGRVVHSEVRNQNGIMDSDAIADQLGAIESKLKTLSEPLNPSTRPSFSNVSHGNQNEVGILQSLEEMDASQLKRRLVNTRNAVQANLVVQREKADQLVSLAKRGVAGSGIANQRIRTTRRPVGGVPDQSLLILFGIGSVLIGVLVAVTYRPELTDKGFSSNQHMSDLLGLPVVAQFRGAGDFRGNIDRLPLGISNRFVTCAEIALWGVALLTVGTCLLNPVIRGSFSENPFSGLARLTWMFFIN